MVLLSGASGGFGDGFALTIVMVAAFVSIHSDNLMTVALVPMLGYGLRNAGALVAGRVISGQSRRLPWAFGAGLVRAGMMALMAYAAYQQDAARSDRLESFLVVFGIFGFASGFASGSITTLIRASVDQSGRARTLFQRSVVAAVLAGLAGVVVRQVFLEASLTPERAFSYAFMAAAASMTASAFFVLIMRETVGPIPRPGRSPGGTPAHARAIRAFRRYLVFRIFLAGAGMADAYLAVFALRDLGMPLDFLGFGVVAVAASTAAGLLFWSMFDRAGAPRTSLQIAALLKIIPPLIALSIPFLQESAFYQERTTGNEALHWLIIGALAATGMATASTIHGGFGYLISLSPGMMPRFGAISNAVLGLATLLALAAGAVGERWGFEKLFALTLAVAIAALLSSGMLAATASAQGKPGIAMTQLPRSLRPNRLSMR